MKYKKIKIAYIIDELNIGGTEKQLCKTIELLDKDRFEVLLICLRPSQYYSAIDIPCTKFIIDVHSLISIHGFLKFLWFVFHLRNHRIDIVQTYFFDSTVFGVLAAKIAGVKIIISCKRDLGFWYTSKLLRVLSIVNRFADRILVNSYAVKEHISKHECISLRKIDIIYNGINTDTSHDNCNGEYIKRNLNISCEDYVVGIVANLNREVKRVDIFIRAAAEILRYIKNVTFIIVGDGYLKNVLKKLAQNLNIYIKIIFTDLQEDVRRYISLFDVGVICSDSEGFSNSILEYMALGIPVVATDVGGNREALEEGKNGILVPVGDYKSIADKICILLKNRKKRLDLGLKGQLIVQQKYEWDRKIKEIETYYRSLINMKI